MSGAATTLPHAPAGSFWLAVWTLSVRELVRFFRQRTRVIGALGQPLLFFVLFGAGLKGSFQAPGWSAGLGHAVSYQEYFFPGVATLIVMFTAIFSTISIIEDRREGFLQGVLVAPVSRLAIVLGKLGGGSALALLQAGLFLSLAPWLGFSFTTGSVVALLGFLTLISMSLTALGFLIAWPMESTQGFHAIMSVFLMPMWLLSGSFFPGGGVGWMSWIIRLNPLTYGVAGLRRLLYWNANLEASPTLPSMGVCIVVMLAFCVVCVTGCVALTQQRRVADAR